MHTYKLKFDNEAQAKSAVGVATSGLKPWDYDVKVIGIHREYEYADPEAEPTVIEYDGWHVDVVSRLPLGFSEQFIVIPKNPIHEFATKALIIHKP